MSRTTFSVTSVATPEDFFGHDTQTMPSGAIASRQAGSFLRNAAALAGEDVHHVERRLQSRDDADIVGQFADDVVIGGRCAVDKNTKARLEAELLHN